jgi:hypothetical protein
VRRPISNAPVMMGAEISCTLKRNSRTNEPSRDIVWQRIGPSRPSCLNVELLQHLDRQRVVARSATARSCFVVSLGSRLME